MDNNKKAWWEDAPENTSDFFEMKVGANKVRVLTKFEKVNQVYAGDYPNTKYVGMVDDSYKPLEGEKVNTQGWAWGIDRTTGEFKILQFGRAILQQMTQLKLDAEYQFAAFPMPYDITINNTGQGATRYSTMAARKNTDITEEEMAQLNKKKSISDIIALIRNKQNEKGKTETKAPYPTEDIDPDKIPF